MLSLKCVYFWKVITIKNLIQPSVFFTELPLYVKFSVKQGIYWYYIDSIIVHTS